MKLPCGHADRRRVGVQYRGTAEDYDGTSEWLCATCGRRWGRWTGKALADGEIEPRYGLKDVASDAIDT